MPRITLTLEPELLDLIQHHKPKRQSLSAFCADLIEQTTLGLDSPSKLPAYRVGAGTHSETTLPAVSAVEAVSPQQPATEAGEASTAVRPKRFEPKLVMSSLKKNEDLLLAFWKSKKGSKSSQAWALLQAEAEKIRDKYGDDLLAQQLELGIQSGKWHSLTLSRMEQFLPKGPAAPSLKPRKKSAEEIAAEEAAAHQQRLVELNLI